MVKTAPDAERSTTAGWDTGHHPRQLTYHGRQALAFLPDGYVAPPPDGDGCSSEMPQDARRSARFQRLSRPPRGHLDGALSPALAQSGAPHEVRCLEGAN